MRLRNALAALAVGVAAATIAPAVLTGPAATAAAATARAAADSLTRPAARLAAEAAAGTVAETGAAPARPGVAASVTAPGPDRGLGPGPVRRPGPGQPGDRAPTCGKASDPDFPIDTRLHGGPTVPHPGGGFQQWSVDLANPPGETCHNIHPVIIFTGRDRGLTADRITLEFYDDEAAVWRPADLETTSEDEVAGVLDDGIPGLVVPAKKSVTVKVRLALAPDTPPNQVTVNAAIVQRQGDDGDWVGESGDYRFAVLDDDGSGAGVTLDELATTGTGSLLRLGAALGVVLLGGGALVLTARRLRAWRR
ncbi:hypothetical protein [Streptomyces lunaelactis]|uniref:hypothetical protein n=1 Tax=Streptomyces lunaelactis TaxID=1535768 RepID=UPI0020C7A016|nr:hypothetical protein [Streptomyces lunaelactis]